MTAACKLFGAALVLTGALLARRSALLRWQRELRTLEALERALTCLEGGVRVTLTPVPELLERLPPQRETAPFFHSVLSALQTDREPALERAWRQSVPLLALEREEADWVAALGAQLDGDERSVSRALLRTAQLLQTTQDNRRQSLTQRRQICSALAFSGGFLLIFLLL